MNKTKTAMITVCGRPNVGKSSLTNALVGEKIAIVSNKPQTTRNRIYGVVNRGDTQYVLLDTPGFHKARNRLGDYMVKVTRESIADVDAVLLLVEPVAHVGIPEAELIEKIKASHLPAILCINKIDTVEKKDDLLAVIAAYSEAYAFDAIIPISARTHEGLDDLMNELGKYASEGPQLFPDGMTTDQPDRQVVGEHLLRKGKPQGYHHRQKRRDAQEDLDRGPPRHRALHGHKGLPRDLGQGQGKLARQYELYQKLRLRRTVSCAEEGKRRFSCEREQAAACAASFGASAENAMGRIHFARQWLNGFPRGGRLRGTNWRDNMNYIRLFGYDEQ